MSSWGDISGLNRGYVLELYEKFRRDPSSVDADTRELFARWAPPEVDVESPAPAASRPAPTSKATDPALLQKVVGAVSLAQSIRRYGHLAAKLDPLGVRPPSGDPSLLPESHSVTEEDLRQLPATLIRSPLAAGAAHVAEVLEALRRLYCSRIGYDYAHVFVPEERRWLRERRRNGPVPVAERSDQPRRPSRAPVSGGGFRAIPASHVSRQDAVLHRRHRHARADPR